MAKKRKKKTIQLPSISPKTYVKEKGRRLPLGPCFASRAPESPDKDKGLFQVVVTRAKPSGKFLVGVYLVDTFCLGVKNTALRINETAEELQELLDFMGESEDEPLVEVPYAWAHCLIYEAIAYAQGLGIFPQKDFALSRYVLEPKDAIKEKFAFEFGRDGKPFLSVGPDDDGPRLMATLRRTVGDGNFHYLYPIGGDGDW